MPSHDSYRHAADHCTHDPNEPPRVAFLGPAGTFTHAAARELFGSAASYVDVATIDGVFDAIRFGEASYGVAPIENSTEGPVAHAVDALIEGGVMIRGERVFEIAQCLMASASSLDSIERVYSHPQALAQCHGWLSRHLAHAERLHSSSTAAAVCEAVNDPAAAAIGSRVAGELHGLPVLRERVHDEGGNATRFVVLGTTDAPRTGDDKTTIIFAVHDVRGALRRVLQVFDDRDVNLSRIESRPNRRRAWDYLFMADLDGHRDDVNIRDATAALIAICPLLRHLGSYPRHREIVVPRDDTGSGLDAG
ncbi:MAG: prephenate dehydratase [Gemmatimonadales bacterium]